MILYEGWYSGVLIPWRHYVPLKKDHSNMDEVVAVLSDERHAQEIIQNAYREIALNPGNSYAAMVARFDHEVEERFSAEMRATRASVLTGWYPAFGLLDRLVWHNRRGEKMLGKLLKHFVWRRRMAVVAWLGHRRRGQVLRASVRKVS